MEKGMGGLGVGSSLLGKWMWRFHTEDTVLWRKVIKEIYGQDGGFGHMAHRRSRIGLWNEIVKSNEYIKKLEIPLDNLIVRKIGSGEQTQFWKDKWCSSGRKLMDLYPRLFALENNKDSRVCDRWCLTNGIWNGNWDWRIPLRGRAVSQLASLKNQIGNLVLYPNRPDSWLGCLARQGAATVAPLLTPPDYDTSC
ncbi:hypothetical protein Tco_0781560 [Tanacetum coccineum]